MGIYAGQKLGADDLGQASTCAQYNATVDQTIGSAADTIMAFGTTNITSTLVTRAVDGVGHSFTLLREGIWAVTVTNRWNLASGGERSTNISCNGATTFIASQSQPGNSGVQATQNVGIIRAYALNDVVRAGVYQSSGSPLDTDADNAHAWGRIDLCWLGG